MKFLEYTPLSSLSAFLQRVNLGDCVVEGEIQAYSCKLAGVDKKISRSLDHEVICSLATTPPQILSASPVGPLTDANSRKTLIYLILTLNHMYPDYDFSTLRSHHFRKEADVRFAKSNIDNFLLETSKVWHEQSLGAQTFSDALWTAVDEVIGLCECDVYCYHGDMEGDPFADERNLWAFNYFFYNRKSKRIVYFSCHSRSKASNCEGAGSSSSEAGGDDYGDEDSFLDSMEIN
mmetsp:Transcript_15299/g.29401  ORF Transcript_15299/g.29401 Transcript_15299/m.29401 type:complete len:234 (-) Transcript_15299:661-1362(-)